MKRRAEVVDSDANGNQEGDKISKNTLESDEEIDEGEKGGRMDEAELQVGQEPETITFDGDIVITPFNMREELEEDGHFDASGTFVFKRTNDAGDNWLEDVDWSEVRRNEQAAGNVCAKKTNIAQEEALPVATMEEQTELYRRTAALLRPGETVLRALRRLGPIRSASGVSTQRRHWARRKDGSTVSSTKTLSPEEAANAEAFAKLTELANELLGSGDFDIYQKTREIIEALIDSRNQKDDNELDALGAEIDDEAGIEPSHANGDSTQRIGTPKWLVKRAKTVEADVQIEGPFEEAILREWLKSASTAVDVFVKRQDANEDFRPLLSVDFDKPQTLPPI